MSHQLPTDYTERVYAGVLGKMIGVYLGRPIESWSYDRIMREIGEVTDYIHERRGVPLIVTDDDLSGTFTFLRALPDYANRLDLTPAQIGQTWLNYIIENRTILWWGGLGNSTEHTAYLRLKQGIPAPKSGSIALNTKVVAEQIGAQIFIDGWAMVAPGNPTLAADLAYRAGSVSHDGEAVYAAQALAAMEAQAFIESDIQKLLDVGLSVIPQDSIISRMIHDIRAWHVEEPDWRETRKRIEKLYGYDIYGGNCHVIPNHALIILALLYGNGDFHRSLMIVNTCGWDTDCNSGNVGCLLGIRSGLAGLEGGPDWRGPVADRLYLPTADGGRTISDAVAETYHIVNIGRTLVNQQPIAPKQGARFNFELPGSLQGFQVDPSSAPAQLENVEGHSRAGTRSLAITCEQLTVETPVRISTPTFIPPDALRMDGYSLMASPTVYSGQTLRVGVSADKTNPFAVTVRPVVQYYGADDTLVALYGPELSLSPGAAEVATWQVPATNGAPIATVGLEALTDQVASCQIYLDYLTWDGEPDVVLDRPEHGGNVWRRAWVNGLDQYDRWSEAYRLIQNTGRGLLIQGTREWQNYSVSTTLTPHMAAASGIAARVQGMRRYYALLITQDNTARLVKVLDGEQVLAETPLAWEQGRAYDLRLQVTGTRLQASIDGKLVFEVEDTEAPLTSGAIALVCEEGRASCDAVRVQPA